MYEASSVISLELVGDSFYYAKLQSMWIALGLVVMIICSFIPYRTWNRFSVFGMMISIVLLMIVLIPAFGTAAGGARSWIDLGFFNIQPTELAKPALLIYLASWFSGRGNMRFLQFLVLVSFLIFLVVLQPDVGSAIIMFTIAVTVYFLVAKDFYKLIFLIPLGIAAFFLLIKIAPYRLNRLISFINPQADPLGTSYHINQILISLASGGLFGTGFGASRQKYLFLPEAHTDSIFAIIGEELGFIGAGVFVITYAALIFLLFRVYQYCNDPFGKVLAGGIFIFFAIQTIVNLGGMVALMPLTGVPLPFLSYGGSHLIPSFALIGIAINIYKHQLMLRKTS